MAPKRTVSRIRPLRRLLLRLALWRDPEARLWPMAEADECLRQAMAGSIEAQTALKWGFIARQYLRGERRAALTRKDSR